MSRLPVPARRVLRSDVDEASIDRVWRNVQRRRAEGARRGPQVAWAAAFAAVAAGVFCVFFWRSTAPGNAAGPLRLQTGGEVGPLASQETARAVVFSDGSRIELEPSTRLEPLENGTAVFSSLLVSGRATFDVRPGGPRRWAIECGFATVEVVGTRFTVERTQGHARVSVERGVVLVRGERVRDRVQRLEAGQALDVEDVTAAAAPTAAAPTAAEPSEPSDPASPSPVASSVSTPSAVPLNAPSTTWRKLADTGKHADAYAELGPAGIASASRAAAGVDELLALADVARLSGHPADAVGPLTRVVNEHAGDSRSPLAAFTLGRLQLDSLQHPSLAAAAFESAIALGLPQSLQEDAYARLVEARAQSGDGAGARAAADEYQRRFPDGKRSDEVRRWVRPE